MRNVLYLLSAGNQLFFSHIHIFMLKFEPQIALLNRKCITQRDNVYIVQVEEAKHQHDIALGILKFQCRIWEFHSTSYSINSQLKLQVHYLHKNILAVEIPKFV